MVLVGSVADVAEVDEAVLDDALEVDALAVADVLAWRSTNSFCRAELKLDPLLLVEFTAPVLLVSVLDEEAPDDEGSNEVLLALLLLLLPVML